MIKKFSFPFLCFIALLSTPIIHANEPTTPVAKFSYFTLKPDITTNYYTEGKQLGFIDVQVDLMVDNPDLIKTLEFNQPLIRNAIIEVFSQESGERVKSLAGREAIRKTCLDKVNEALVSETGEKILSDLLFTKYLYQ